MRKESGKKEVRVPFQIRSHDCAFSVKLSAQHSLGAYEPQQYLLGIGTWLRRLLAFGSSSYGVSCLS